MLRATTQPQTTRFYGKTNWGEFAWFVIFMGSLGLGMLVTMICGDIYRLTRIPRYVYFLISPANIISYILIISFTSFILYWGFVMRWEYKEGGKNAVADFWKKYWSGKVPRLVDIRVEQPSLDDYVKQLGKYPEDLGPGELGEKYVKFKEEFGDDEYVVFDFYRGIMHVDVYVYIPVRTFMKLEKLLDGRKYRVLKNGKILRYEDGEEIELSEDEYEALRFLSILAEKQPENIRYIRELKERLKTGRIGLREYIIDAYRFKFWGKKKKVK